MQRIINDFVTEWSEKMAFLKKRFKRVTAMGLALLMAASTLPGTAFAASESTLAEVTAKFLDAENGKEIIQPETYSVGTSISC